MIHYKSILCLNGDLPNKDFFTRSVPIIAADGAADKLLDIGIIPGLVIGDLDSIKNLANIKCEVIHTPDQNQSDFQKALLYIKENNLLPVLVTGVAGGVIDHILFNINVAMESECIFYAPPVLGIPLKGMREFNLKLNSKISIFAMPKAKVSSKGLKWELNDTILELPGFNSLSNVNIKKNFTIEVKEGKALLFAYVDEMEDICIDYV